MAFYFMADINGGPIRSLLTISGGPSSKYDLGKHERNAREDLRGSPQTGWVVEMYLAVDTSIFGSPKNGWVFNMVSMFNSTILP